MQCTSRQAARSLIGFYLQALRHGAFPMGTGESRFGITWFEAEPRGILPLQNFRFPRRLRRTVRRLDVLATVNRDFDAVIRHCADRSDRWINDAIILLFTELHGAGVAHSIEVRIEGRLVGGLYGVAVGGLFSGESMFSLVPSASQIALLHLVDRLRQGGFSLLDVQFKTEHLERFGATEVPREEYRELLERALAEGATFPVHPASESTSSVLQRMSQTS